MKMEEQRLNRTDQRPLVFLGEEVGFASNKTDPRQSRWTNLRLFMKETGEYVLGAACLTCWDGERDQLKANKFKTLEDALRFVDREYPDLSETLAEDINERKAVAR
jgi:hypothetical protein